MRSATTAVETAYARIAADASPGIFIELVARDDALAAAAEIDAAVAAGERRPLAGRTLAVKGNIDVAGYRTTAGCPAYGETAARSAPVVRALEAAGAVVVAITNLDQFATGLVGTRSPHGVCPNAHWPALISGGSSSGSAVAVARGLVDFALGTDTAGSGRVPAAANGIVGLKPTRGWLSTAGIVPACHSIDCVAVLAAEVERGWEAVTIAAGFDADDPFSRHAPGGDRHPLPSRVAVAHGVPSEVVSALEGAGVETVPADIEPFLAAGRLLYDGAFVAERYSAVGAFIDAHPDDVDPVVRSIISASARLPAWQLSRDLETLAQLRRTTETTWSSFDALVVPTVPRIPTVAEVLADPVRTNSALGTYTNFVNLLDLCAITMPFSAPSGDAPPPSITFVAPAWHDDGLLHLARLVTPDMVATPRSA